MTDIPVLAAGQRRTLQLDSVAYTVRALTYAEHSGLQLARAEQRVASLEMINEALREAAEAAGRADLAEAVTAHEEAEDALSAFYAAAPPALDADGRALWLADHQAEHARLQADLLRTGRKRRLALEMFGDAAPLKKLREGTAAAMRDAALDLIVAGLIEIDGRPVRLDRDTAGDLPSPHVPALADAIGALLSPSADAAKN
jgi:hypothetical protein